MHPPKVSRYDLNAKIHAVDRDSYPVDRYERGDGWLYLARPFVDHPHIAAMEAYLLPALGLQVNRWEHRPGSPYAWCDFYVDVMSFEVGQTLWTSRDLYLDVVVTEGKSARILDTDEFLQARAEGLLTAEEADAGLTAAHNLLNGLGKCGYDLDNYLQTEGVTLTWRKLKFTL